MAKETLDGLYKDTKKRNTKTETTDQKILETSGDFNRYDTTKKRPNKNLALFGIVGLLLLALLAALAYYFLRPDSPEERIAEVVEALSHHMIVPPETPTLFTIEDPALLVSEQKFFESSEKGDVLLVFQQAQKAIIYSEARDMIVNVGPVTFDGSNSGTIPALDSATPQPTSEPVSEAVPEPEITTETVSEPVEETPE